MRGRIFFSGRLLGLWALFVLWGFVSFFSINLSDYDSKRLVLAVSLSLAGLSWGFLKNKFDLPRHYAFFFFSAFLFGGISSFASELPLWGFLELSTYLLASMSVVVLGLALVRLRISPETSLAVFFVVPVLLYSIKSLAGLWAAYSGSAALVYPEPISGFFNIRFFNQYQTWVLPLLPAALLLGSPVPGVRRGLWVALVFIVGCFFWALYWRSMGRGTLYAIAAATVLVWVWGGVHWSRYCLASFGLSLAGYLAFLLVFASPPGLMQSEILSVDSPGRLYLWCIAVELIAEHPALGVGPMQFATVDNTVAAHPHNFILQWVTEWGVLGAGVLLSALVFLITCWLLAVRSELRVCSSGRKAWLAAITTSVLAALAHGLLTGIVVMPASIAMAVIVLSLMYAYWPEGATGAGEAGGTFQKSEVCFQGALGFAGVTLALYALCLTVVSFHAVSKDMVLLRHPSDLMEPLPRYWKAGRLAGAAGTEAPKGVRFVASEASVELGKCLE